MSNTENPFGAPPAEGDDADLFSIDVPVDNGYRVKAGKQPLKLISLEKSISSAKNPMWVWTFAVVLGADAGKEVRCYTALTAAAMWKLREVLGAFRIAGAEGGANAKFKRSEVIGKYILAEVEDSTYDGKPGSNINKMYPVSDEDLPRIEASAKAALTNDAPPPF